MLAKIIVRMLGGIWKIKQRYRNTNNKILKVIYGLLYNTILKRRCSWISLASTFSGEPCFPHGIFGIFISGGAVVGKNCVIFPHVTIGSNTLCDSGGFGAPSIGDNCYIGAGAKIIGNIKIGNNTRIGANTFVYQDISENSVITSGTPRIVRMQRRLNNKFYHKSKGKWEYFDNGDWIKVHDPKELLLFDRHFL